VRKVGWKSRRAECIKSHQWQADPSADAATAQAEVDRGMFASLCHDSSAGLEGVLRTIEREVSSAISGWVAQLWRREDGMQGGSGETRVV
jgi:hypothetical protein